MEENSPKTSEQYFYFSMNGKENIEKTKAFFELLNVTAD